MDMNQVYEYYCKHVRGWGESWKDYRLRWKEALFEEDFAPAEVTEVQERGQADCQHFSSSSSSVAGGRRMNRSTAACLHVQKPLVTLDEVKNTAPWHKPHK